MRRQRVARGVAANLIDQGVIVLIQLLTVALLVRFWGAAGFGIWAMVTAIPAMLALGDLGFGAVAAARMTMEVARGEPAQAGETLRAALRVVACAALILGLGAGLLAGFGQSWLAAAIPQLSSTELVLLPIALAVYAIGVLFAGLSQALFRSSGRFAQGMLLSTLTNAAEAALLFLTAGLGWGIGWAAAAWACGRLLGTALQWVIAARAMPALLQGWARPAANRVRELIVPSLSATALPLARALLLQVTVIVLGGIAGALAVPAFVAARTLSRIGLQGGQLLALALMPEFGAAAAQGNRRSLVRMVVLVAVTAGAVSIPFAILLALFGPWVIGLWTGQAVAASGTLLMVMALSALFGGLWNPLSNLLLAVNRQVEFAWIYAGLAVSGVAFTAATAARLGSIAPALAFAGIDLVMLLLIARVVWQSWAKEADLRETLHGLYRDGKALVAARFEARG